MSELIVNLPAIDQDLASIRQVGVLDQLNCSVQLLDRISEETLSQQQETVLRSRDNCQLTQRSAAGELLCFDE